MKTSPVKRRFRKDRGKYFTRPTEEITCEWCKEKKIVEKSYGTWKDGKRIMPKHRFCCRDHHWKYHAKYGKRAIGGKGDNNHLWVKVDISLIEKLWQQGKYQKDIAKELGVSKSTIYHRIKQYQIKKVNRGKIRKIRKEFTKTGIPYTHLAHKYRLGTQTMRKILKGLNYRKNTKQSHTYKGISDNKVKVIMRKRGFKVIECGNICLDKKRNDLPLDICKLCPIKEAGKLDKMSYFDMVLAKDNKFYLTEVKSTHDSFSWNQTVNLIKLKSKGVNIYLIKIDMENNLCLIGD